MAPDIEDSDTPGYYVTTLETRLRPTRLPIISTPQDLYDLVAPLVAGADREHFLGVYLTTKNGLLRVETVSIGSLSASLVHPREVLKPAIVYSAAAFAVAHCHPSGDPEPSPEDREFTRRLKQASDIVGIRFLDRVILGADSYVSLKSRGEL